MSRRFTIWQCTDFCCDHRPYADKWWNVGVAPGNYHSVPTWAHALRIALVAKRLPWT